MTPAEEADVRGALRRVWPDLATVDEVELRRLGGGLNARSYLATAPGRRSVLRLPIASAVAWLDLETEVRAMRAAAAAGLAPAVVAADVEAGLLLTEYRAEPWTVSILRERESIAYVAGLLRALHRLDTELPVYSVRWFASTYLATLAAAGGRGLSSEERKWADELSALAESFDAAHPPTAFCHNDLAATNIVGGRRAAGFIDFEYAGRGAPLLDLASLAGMNDFAESERRHLLREYYGRAASAPTMRDLDSAIRIVRLLGYFWGRVAEVRVTDPRAHLELAANFGELLRRD